jgi:leucyl-tRNA synthetase
MPVSFNGKTRFTLSVAPETSREEIERLALESPEAAKWIEGKTIRKIIVVPNKIINVVVG